MAYTDLTAEFSYKDLLTSNNMDALGENDAHIGGQITNFRRPNLVWVDGTYLDVEANASIANATKIVFPDGDVRTVYEVTTSTHKYRRLQINATAQFTSGTEDSGLRSGESADANFFYAIYAVKSQINSSNFVLVASRVLFPAQANIATLNSAFGTGSWLYLGTIANGINDGSGATENIARFVQCGHRFYITKQRTHGAGVGGSSNNPYQGILYAGDTGTDVITYTYVGGATVGLSWPSHFNNVLWIVGAEAQTAFPTRITITNAAETRTYWREYYPTTSSIYETFITVEMPQIEGIRVRTYGSGGSNSLRIEACLYGWTDLILALNGLSLM